MISTVRIIVSGRVQGVFFRKSTKDKADELGIVGTVRNLENGKVEIVAQAGNEKLDAFIGWCHKGPVMAKVTQVDITNLASYEGEFISFKVV